MRWAAAAGTRYCTPHWAACRTSTGSPIVRPRTCQGPRSGVASGVASTEVGAAVAVMSAVQHRQGYRCPVAYWIMKAIISPFLLLLWRVKVEGREHVPTDGPVLLAANHQSFCDSFFLPFVVRRRVTYVAKAEYFDNWKTGVARLSLGCDVPVIPVGIIGTRKVQPPGSMVMRPFYSVTVRFGPPVSY